tara:strand:- start:1161 stop:1370 length:210 start_codon:yes stop_codon:yes gene_type:complete
VDPKSCEQRSDDDCGCLEWDYLEAMAAKAKVVTSGECVVVEQSPLPSGVEGGIGVAVGLLLTLLWAFLR